MTTIQVSSVMQAVVAAGYVQVTTSTRETKGNKVEAANRSRSIIIPELVITGLPQKFQDFVLSQLYLIAKQQLAEWWKDAGNDATQIEEELFTVDSLLTYAARKSETLRLNGELVKQNFEEFIATQPTEKQEKIRDALISCAAPTPALGLKQCEYLLAELSKFLEDKEDSSEEEYTTWVHRSVLRKITDHQEKLAQLNDAF